MAHTLTVGIDADDTLWHSEDGFEDTIAAYIELLVDRGVDHSREHIRTVLDRTESTNLALLGYGVKAYTISMVEAAVVLGGAAIAPNVVNEVIELGKNLLNRPVELLPGVAETLPLLAGGYPLILITKGDLLHQERKVHESGLADHFQAIEVVSEKDPASYTRLLREHRIDPATFVMVGNSVKSDVLPVLAIGGRAVHIPYHLTWAHERAEHDGTVPELAAFADLPGWLARHLAATT
jgi:putative hydrolase of the HAD superfamily